MPIRTIFLRWFFGVIILIGSLTIVPCATAQDAAIVIGFSLGTLREERWERDKELFVKRAKELGAEVVVLFANNDSQLQISQAENLIFQGVDVLVVVPQDSERSAEIVQMAQAEGIKVIAYDRLIKNCKLDYYVSFDNVKVGELQAKSILAVVDRGDFAYLGGSPLDNNAFLFKEGVLNLLQPKIDSGDVNLVVDEFSKDWKPEEAYKHLKSYLEQGKSVNAVVCANDGTAFGAIKALREYGLEGKVPVSGQDAELSACRRIVEGVQAMTVYKPVKLLANKAAEMAIAVAQGKTLEMNSVVNNGLIDVPSFLIEPIAVDANNMQATIIRDNYHSYEQVYQGIEE